MFNWSCGTFAMKCHSERSGNDIFLITIVTQLATYTQEAYFRKGTFLENGCYATAMQFSSAHLSL